MQQLKFFSLIFPPRSIANDTVLRSARKALSPIPFAAMNRAAFLAPVGVLRAPHRRQHSQQATCSALGKRVRDLATAPSSRPELNTLIADLEAAGGAAPPPLRNPYSLDGAWDLVLRESGGRSGRAQEVSIGAAGEVWQDVDVGRGWLENGAKGRWWEFGVGASFKVLEGERMVEVLFEKAWLKIIGIRFWFPVKWVGGIGKLDCTYVDEEVRIGRGSKGSLFVLVRPEEGVTREMVVKG